MRKQAERIVYKIRLSKGDTVVVRAGKQKGQAGKVVAVHPLLNKVTVEGVNIVKKAVKPTKQRPQGGIIEITKPIWVSKVGIQAEAKGGPSRIRFEIKKDGTKVRVATKSGKEIK